MGFSCGIVGLPNVGKSTIFNALTSGKAVAANFPFCTIEPNTGTVPVPDERLMTIAKLAGSAQMIATKLSFVDIAGLIRGASKGEGLGNQFLGHIRSVDAIVHVVRCFEDPNTIHVENSVDPVRDADIILTELILCDLESVTKQLEKQQKIARSGNAEAKTMIARLETMETHLGRGFPARSLLLSEEFTGFEFPIELLTAKPMLLVANLSEDQIEHGLAGTPHGEELQKFASSHGFDILCLCGKLEADLVELDEEERREYKEALNISMSGLEQMIISGYRMLDLLTFFTAGPKEARAWTATKGSSAPICAGKIHSDFVKHFIRAEVTGYSDFVQYGGELGAKEAGKLRIEGRDYIVNDGDVIFFRVGR